MINASSSVRIFYNTITELGSTSIGIEITSSENTTIIWNTVSMNIHGLLFGNSYLNTVLYDDFLNNEKHVETRGLVQFNKWMMEKKETTGITIHVLTMITITFGIIHTS